MAFVRLSTYELRSPNLGHEYVSLSIADDAMRAEDGFRYSTSNIKLPPPPPQGNFQDARIAFEASLREAGWTIEYSTHHHGPDREHPIPLVPTAKKAREDAIEVAKTLPAPEKGELLHGPWKDEGGLQLLIETGTEGRYELFYAWPGDDWSRSADGDPLQFALVREIVRLKAEATTSQATQTGKAAADGE